MEFDTEMRNDAIVPPTSTADPVPVEQAEQPKTKKPRSFVPSELIREASRGHRTDLPHVDTHPSTPRKGQKQHNRDPIFPLQQQRKQYADGGRAFRETRRAMSDQCVVTCTFFDFRGRLARNRSLNISGPSCRRYFLAFADPPAVATASTNLTAVALRRRSQSRLAIIAYPYPVLPRIVVANKRRDVEKGGGGEERRREGSIHFSHSIPHSLSQ